MQEREWWKAPKRVRSGSVIVAAFGPGFSADLSRWRLAIHPERSLFQDVHVWQHAGRSGIVEEEREEHVPLAPEQVQRILQVAEDVGFALFGDFYDAGVDDLEWQGLWVKLGEREKKVEAHGAAWLAHKGNEEMRGFLKLWDAVHEPAPFGRR